MDEAPNYDFLGHPLNAYLFVRHVANGWSKIKEQLDKIDVNSTKEFRKQKYIVNPFSSEPTVDPVPALLCGKKRLKIKQFCHVTYITEEYFFYNKSFFFPSRDPRGP